MRKSLMVMAVSLLAIIAVLFVMSVGPRISAAAQNSSGRTTNRNENQNQNRSIEPPSGASQANPKPAAPQPDFSKNTWELPANAGETKNPTTANEESIAKGKELYLDRQKGNCIFCHGETGAGNEATADRMRRKPADLSNKERMTAMTDGEVFWKVSKGIQGIMPAGDRRMSEEERWHVVNYVRTLAKAK